MSNEPILFAESRELIEEILQRLAEGETLRSIVEDVSANEPQYRNLRTFIVREWTRSYEDFGKQYDQALIDGADALADQMEEIAAHPTMTEVITEKWSGGRKPKLEERTVKIVDNLERDKLRILVKQYRARMQSVKVRTAEKPALALSGDSGEGGSIVVEVRGGLPVRPQDLPDPVPINKTEDPAT